MSDVTSPQRGPLPVGSIGRHRCSAGGGLPASSSTEAALFTYLLFSLRLLAVQGAGGWPPDGPPSFLLRAAATVSRSSAAAPRRWAERGVRQGMRGQLLLGLSVAFLLGLAFVALELLEWRASRSPSAPAPTARPSSYTGFTSSMSSPACSPCCWSCVVGPRLFRREAQRAGADHGGYWHFVVRSRWCSSRALRGALSGVRAMTADADTSVPATIPRPTATA